MINFMKCTSENPNTLFEDFKFPIAEKLRDNINWDKVFTVIQSYQSSHNENMMRFVKSYLVSKAIERYSNGYLKYVNQIGWDFETPESIKIELKSQLKSFNKRNETTADIVVKNMQGEIANLTKIQKTFDYLLILEPGLAAVTSWETCFPYFRERSDTINVKLEFKHLDFFKKIDRVKDTKANLADRIDEAIEKALDDIDELYESTN